jgi:nitrate/TMAO reductase-like tetraheme cytochrome c subunit
MPGTTEQPRGTPEGHHSALANASHAPTSNRPSTRRQRRARTTIIVVAAVLVALVVAAFVAAEVTAKSTFCTNCHEMDPYNTSWQASTHRSAECAQCHVPPGFVHFVATKVYALREVWVHLTGQVKAPLAVTRQIPDASCHRCHETPANRTLGNNAAFSHEKHVATSCIACHTRLVHQGVLGEDPLVVYVDPALMTSCFRCHDVSKIEGGCAYCHTPPHNPRGACSDCHNTQSWSEAGPANHPFALTGKHATLQCADCHKAGSSLGLIPGTDLGKASPECSFCHTPAHEPRGVCSDCHNTNSFAGARLANHPFALTGKHATLQCADCHKAGSSLGLIPGTDLGKASPECSFCHQAPHVTPKDCARCHEPSGWTPVNFSHAPVGEHIPRGEVTVACADCHPDGYGSNTCTKCHSGTPRGD